MASLCWIPLDLKVHDKYCYNQEARVVDTCCFVEYFISPNPFFLSLMQTQGIHVYLFGCRNITTKRNGQIILFTIIFRGLCPAFFHVLLSTTALLYIEKLFLKYKYLWMYYLWFGGSLFPLLFNSLFSSCI